MKFTVFYVQGGICYKLLVNNVESPEAAKTKFVEAGRGSLACLAW